MLKKKEKDHSLFQHYIAIEHWFLHCLALEIQYYFTILHIEGLVLIFFSKITHEILMSSLE